MASPVWDAELPAQLPEGNFPWPFKPVASSPAYPPGLDAPHTSEAVFAGQAQNSIIAQKLPKVSENFFLLSIQARAGALSGPEFDAFRAWPH